MITPGSGALQWDGHSAHKAQPIRAWLARQRRIVVEPLPAYAPELNPVEQVWNHTKGADLANHTPDSLAAVADTVVGALTGTSGEQALIEGFMRATELEPMYH